MDGAQACYLYFTVRGWYDALTSRQAWRSVKKPLLWSWVERPLVQILVVVANIQMRTLKTEVGKGSMSTAVGHGLVDPKRWGSSVSMCLIFQANHRKGIRLKFRNLDMDSSRQRNWMWRRRREPWEELSFLLNSLSPWNWFIRRWGLMAGRAR